MRLFILLQFMSAVGYYLTSPFQISFSIALVLIINLVALVILWIDCTPASKRASSRYRNSRLVFTGTLFLLEFLIGLTDSPVSTTELQGVFNDGEVLFTGILLGVLWHDEILDIKLFSKP